MFRRVSRFVAAAGIAALAVGFSAGGADAASGGADAALNAADAADKAGSGRRALPADDRAKLAHSLGKVFDALPHLPKGYMRDRRHDSKQFAFATTASAFAATAPAGASETHVYGKPAGTGPDANKGEMVTLEIRAYINWERTLPEPLGSEGGSLQAFTHDGMPCTRASLAGVTSGRVALPLASNEERNALTVLRAHVGADSIGAYLTEIAQGRTPTETPWGDAPVRRPSDVRTIVVEFYGPRADVEALLNGTSAAPLKKLLTP
jgi:hypothetical protein